MARQTDGWCYKEKKNGRLTGKWRAGYRDRAGKKHQRLFDTEAAGNTWKNNELVKLGQRSHIDPEASEQPLRIWWEKSVAVRRAKLKGRSLRDIDVIWRKWIEPYIGDVAIGAFADVDVIDEWLEKIRADGCSESRVHTALAWLKPVLTYAVRRRVLVANSASRYENARKPKRKHIEALEAEHVWRLADEIALKYRALIILLGFEGLRFGEAAALRVKDFDRKHLTLSITKNVDDAPGGGIEQDSPKSGKPRVIDLYPSVAEELKEHLHRLGIETNRDALIFPNSKGGFMSIRQFGKRPAKRKGRNGWDERAFHKARAAIGLPEEVTVHWLRHTAASIAIDNGQTVLEVCELLGHWDPSYTLSTYAHLFRRKQRQRLDVTEAAISAARSEGQVVAFGR